MPKRPYILCRYQISDGEELLDAAAQMSFFRENQGQYRPHRRGRTGREANALIMEADPFETHGGFDAISFYVGYQPGYRLKRGYDSRSQRRTSKVVDDDNIKAAHIVAVPALGCMAIEDRIGEHNIPQGTAIMALRSIVRATFEDGDVNVMHLTDDEVRNILQEWELVQYDYVIRPLNPISVSDLADLRSEAMKLDNVAMDSGSLKPPKGDTMSAQGGIITQTQAVVDEGYGQSGGRAITPGGDEARFPEAQVSHEQEQNLAEREKPRFLKILFEFEDDDTPDMVAIARTLVSFYQ